MVHSSRPSWTFLTNHTHVLVCLVRDSEMLMRQIAQEVGITERQVINIISELTEAGVVTKTRDGRRNLYDVNLDCELRHPLEAPSTVGDLLNKIIQKPLSGTKSP
jgi:hypothetical protein